MGKDRAAVLTMTLGNLVVASGVLVVPGMLDRLSADLGIGIASAGSLLSLAALAMCLGAPLLAGLTSRIDRRILLTVSLAEVAVGHFLCAIAPDYAVLAIVRPFSVLGAALFTPQAAATLALIVPQDKRATAVTTAFLGWSIASVVGMPLGNLVASYVSWRASFALIAGAAVVIAVLVWRVIPGGLMVPPLSLRSWGDVAANRRLRLILLATFAWCSGHFMVLGYIAPLLRRLLDAPPGTLALMMLIFGVCGIAGNFALSRLVGRIGADRCARWTLVLVACGMALWSLASAFMLAIATLGAAMAVWGLGSFAFVSAQQARLAQTAPALSSASLALNSSALYAGQAAGSVMGAAILGGGGQGGPGPYAFVIVLAALALCILADRRRTTA